MYAFNQFLTYTPYTENSLDRRSTFCRSTLIEYQQTKEGDLG